MSDEGWIQSENERQLANLIRIGRITELDEANARIRVDVAGATTDWLPWVTARAGATRTWSAPRTGEQVVVLSPYGDLGQAVVLPSIYQDDHNAPAVSQDIEKTVYPDGTVVEYNSATNTMTLTIADSGNIIINGNLTINGNVSIVGDTLTHNSKNVGSTHQHSGIQPGGANTGNPV